MEIYLEPNERWGKGYQARFLNVPDGSSKVFDDSGKDATESSKEITTVVMDDEPYSLYDAVRRVAVIVDELSVALGIAFDLQQILWLTEDGVRRNAGRDIASYLMLQELEAGSPRFTDLPCKIE